MEEKAILKLFSLMMMMMMMMMMTIMIMNISFFLSIIPRTTFRRKDLKYLQ